MQTILVISALLAIALLVWGFIATWIKVNQRCINHYAYRPLNNVNVSVAIIAMICLWTGMSLAFVERPERHDGFYSTDFIHNQMDLSYESASKLLQDYRFWQSVRGNGVVIGVIGILLGIILFLRLCIKTSLVMALLSCFLLSVVGSLFFIAIAILIIGVCCAIDRSNKKVVIVSRY